MCLAQSVCVLHDQWWESPPTTPKSIFTAHSEGCVNHPSKHQLWNRWGENLVSAILSLFFPTIPASLGKFEETVSYQKCLWLQVEDKNLPGQTGHCIRSERTPTVSPLWVEGIKQQELPAFHTGRPSLSTNRRSTKKMYDKKTRKKMPWNTWEQTGSILHIPSLSTHISWPKRRPLTP